MLNHSAFNEGKAAAILGQEMRANPYRRYIAAQTTPYEGVYWELASDFDSGFIAGLAIKGKDNASA